MNDNDYHLDLQVFIYNYLYAKVYAIHKESIYKEDLSFGIASDSKI